MTDFLLRLFENADYSFNTMRDRIGYFNKRKIGENNYLEVLDKDRDELLKESDKVESNRSHCFHIIAFLKHVKLMDKLDDKTLEKVDELEKYYKAKGDELFKEAQKLRLLNKGNKYMKLEDLQDILKKKEPTMEIPIKVDKLLPKKEYDEYKNLYKYYENYCILCMYVFQPAIRNDFYQMKIVYNKKDINTTDNFILISPRSIYLYLNKFKTKDNFGSVRLELNQFTVKQIRNMLKLRKALGYTTESLFNHVTAKAITPIQTPTAFINRLGNNSYKFFGKKYTINIYRSIWETSIQHDPNYQNLSLEERENIHKQLLHHTSVALSYNRV